MSLRFIDKMAIFSTFDYKFFQIDHIFDILENTLERFYNPVNFI